MIDGSASCSCSINMGMEGWKDVDRPQSLFYFVPQEKELCSESHIQTGLAWKDVVPVQYCSGSMMEWDGRGE